MQHDAFVSLACISNDASFELDEKLSTSINYDAFEPMVLVAKNAGVKRFVYASSSSVYGVSDQADEVGCHIITATNDVLAKLQLVGKDLTEYSRETVQMFYRDANACGFAVRTKAAA